MYTYMYIYIYIYIYRTQVSQLYPAAEKPYIYIYISGIDCRVTPPSTSSI